MEGKNSREQWGSRLGFIMAAAGSAIGLGSIWRFPYVAGMYGGGAFTLTYILMVFTIGISIMSAEILVGRKGRLNAVGSFKRIGGGGWPLVGWLGVSAGFIILTFYGVIGGWTLAYVLKSFTGLMAAGANGTAGDLFNAFMADKPLQIVYQALFMLITVWVVYRGVGGGIERLCNVAMPALFIMMLILIVRAITLQGTPGNPMDGLVYFLKPDFSKFSGEMVLAALGQAFFSLSLGIGAIIIYGSYLPEETDIPSASAMICFMTALVAVMAGLIIFPALFAYNVAPTSGPGLTFIALPSTFAQMPGSVLWAALFFILFFFAGLTSSVSLLEVPVSYCIDTLKWSRKKATLGMGGIIFLLGIPSVLSGSFLDLANYLTANIMMPLGGFFIAIFVGWFFSSTAEEDLKRTGSAGWVIQCWSFICRFLAPACIVVIFLEGIL